MGLKLLSYEELEITLDSKTPHCLITGSNIDEIIKLENAMIESIKESGGDNVNIHCINNPSCKAVDMLKHGINGFYRSRYEELVRVGAGNIEKYNEDRNKKPYEVFIFPIISPTEELLSILKSATMLIQVGVHIICGLTTTYNQEIDKYLSGYTTRFAFPFKEQIINQAFFVADEKDLPKKGKLWYKLGINGEVKVLN